MQLALVRLRPRQSAARVADETQFCAHRTLSNLSALLIGRKAAICETYKKKVTSAPCSKFPRTPAILDDGPSSPVCSTDLDNCPLLGVELLHGNNGIHPGTSIRRC